MSRIIITLPKQEKGRLMRLALRYGLSLPEFSRKILEELSVLFPEESFNDYKNPKHLKASFNKALTEWKVGQVSEGL